MTEHSPHNIEELKHELEAHDEWFRHSPDETHQAAHGDFNPYVVMTFLAITIVIVVGVAFLLVPWFARMVQAEEVRTREDNPRVLQEYVEARTAWEADLTGEPTWIDEEAGVIRVPISIAIEGIVERYGSGAPQSGVAE